jgi:hypothetical protein
VECLFLGREPPFLAFLASGRHLLRPLPRWPKQAGFWEKIFRAILDVILPACGGRLDDWRERKPARRRTHDYGRFFAEIVPKRYTFGTEHPLSGWIWRSWNERQNVGCSDKTLTTVRPSAGPSPSDFEISEGQLPV